MREILQQKWLIRTGESYSHLFIQDHHQGNYNGIRNIGDYGNGCSLLIVL